MYAKHLVLLLGGSQLALSAAVHQPHRRDATPKNPHDDKTTEYCTWWVDYNEKISCDALLKDNQIDIKKFKRWNPSIKDTCQGLTVGQSYCVEAMFEPTDPEPEPEPEEPEPEPEPEEPEPSPTKQSNGIETPDAIQPGMVTKNEGRAEIASKHGITLAQFTKWNSEVGSNCNVLWADTYACHGITLAQFTKWNSEVGSNCNVLWADTYACVSIIGHEPSPTKPTPTNGIETPSPIQEGMVNNCNKFHLVKTTTTCTSIETYYKLPLATFKKWNPPLVLTVGPYWPTTGNDITTPSPIQANMNKNCNKFHLVKSTTTCASISDYYNLPLKDFYSWNPSVGSNCQSLFAEYNVCVSIVGWKPPTPSPANPGNGISTPSPIQANMVKNCNKFHLVAKTTTCASIQDYYKITMAQIAE
ncbi:hypothetical protein ACHAPJ_004224 [Fusarium lateritium]